MSEMLNTIKAMVTGYVTKANAIADEVKSSRVDVKKLCHDFRNDEAPTDPKIVAWKSWKEKADAVYEKNLTELDAYIKENLIAKSKMTDEVFATKKEEHKALKKKYDNAIAMAADVDDYDAELFKDVPELKNLGGTTSAAPGSTGIKRTRLSFLSIDGKEVFVMKPNKKTGEQEKSYTFTTAANVIAAVTKTKVLPSELAAVAFLEAKTDDLSTVAEVKFSYSVNGANFMVVAIPASATA